MKIKDSFKGLHRPLDHHRRVWGLAPFLVRESRLANGQVPHRYGSWVGRTTREMLRLIGPGRRSGFPIHPK